MVAGDPSRTTKCERKKIILAANALQHLLPNPEKPPKFKHRSPDATSPGRIGGIRSRDDARYECIIVAVSCTIYGLVHLLALNGHFPTPSERLHWCVNSVVVTLSGLVGASLIFISTELLNINTRILVVFGIVIAVVHQLASLLLLLESVGRLPFSDRAVYQVPSWPNYWPHFS